MVRTLDKFHVSSEGDLSSKQDIVLVFNDGVQESIGEKGYEKFKRTHFEALKPSLLRLGGEPTKKPYSAGGGFPAAEASSTMPTPPPLRSSTRIFVASSLQLAEVPPPPPIITRLVLTLNSMVEVEDAETHVKEIKSVRSFIGTEDGKLQILAFIERSGAVPNDAVSKELKSALKAFKKQKNAGGK